MRLSGLEPFTLTTDIPFVNVGERTNVTGSAKFRKLITTGDYAAALDVARDQVANGAQIIDVNMDEGLLDSEKAMVEFLNLVAAEPDIARVPVMVDSSKFHVIEAGLKCIQGKAIVNSISMKEGEETFMRAREDLPLLRRRRRRDGLRRAGPGRYAWSARSRSARAPTRSLTEQIGFPPEDIIFDPNVFAVATGIEEHNGYGVAFIEATRASSARRCRTSISRAACRTCPSRSAATSPCARRCTRCSSTTPSSAGMDMGIVNAGQLAVYDEIDPELRELCEDVVLNRRPDATERLLEPRRALQGRRRGRVKAADLEWRSWPVEEAARACARQRHHRIHRADTEEARQRPSVRCT